MKSNYAKKLNYSNMILGIHVTFKLVIILILFVVLYTSIWIKEFYLIYIKVSVYVQIFVFLTLSIVILVLNNPQSMDICSNFINIFYLIISILELGIIVVEIYFMIKNLNIFLTSFHECPYIRTYEEITDLEFRRTCLFYNIDNNNELPYKYICYYNSENEYYNSFCDGLICKKNINKNEINSLVKCYKNIDKNEIKFPFENEFYLKEFELIYKYKSSNLYACFRKNKVEENENVFNKKCPDSNPVKKMLIFIYSDFILHFLIDFLFIYEFIKIKKVKEIYSNLVILENANQDNILSNEDEINIQNFFNNSKTNNKQTYNTDNINQGQYQYQSYQIQRENAETIIIVPGYKNSEVEEIKSNYNEEDNNKTGIIKSTESQLDQYDNIIVHYNPNQQEIKNNEKNENDGVISRKAKIFNYKKKINEENKKEIDLVRDNQRIILEINREEEYGINRINFFIKKKNRKNTNQKRKKSKNNIPRKKDLKNDIINKNISLNNYNNIHISKVKNFLMFNNINSLSNFNSINKNIKTSKSFNNCSNSLNPLIDEQESKVKINKKLHENKKFITNQEEKNKVEFNKELLENNLNINEIANKKINIKYFEAEDNEEFKNNLDNSSKYKDLLNKKINLKKEEEEEKVMDNKGIKNNYNDNKNSK